MKLIIDRDVLMENLNILSKGLATKSALPVTQNIKIEIIDKEVYLTASSSDLSLLVVISGDDVQIEEPGKSLFPGRLFIEFIRKITCKKIKLEIYEEQNLIITSDKGEYNLRVGNFYEYPNIDFIKLVNPVNLKSSVIKSIVKQITFASSTITRKPILMGVNIKFSETYIHATATDSFRLSQNKFNIYKELPELSFTIPSRSLEELSRCFDDNNIDIALYTEKDRVLFRFKNVLFQTRLLDGEYPNTSRLIPANLPINISFNKEEFVEALDRVSILSPKESDKDDISSNIVTLNIKKDMSVEITASSSISGDARELLIPTSNNITETFRITVSAKYLLDALKSYTNNEVTFSFSVENRPILIRSAKYNTNEESPDNLLTQLVLPIRPE